MTEPETRKLIALMAGAFTNQIITNETVAVYCMMLADISFDDAQQAVKSLLATSRFFPTIAEIRGTVAQLNAELPSAEIGWGEVMQQVKAVGIYGQPDWSSEALRRAVRAVGWENICVCELDQLNTLRSQFLRIFNAYREAELRHSNLDSLHADAEPERLDTGTDGPRPISEIVPIRRKRGS